MFLLEITLFCLEFCEECTCTNCTCIASITMIKLLIYVIQGCTQCTGMKNIFAQSIQSVRLSVHSSALGPPTHSSASEYCSAPLGPRGRHTRWGRGDWGGPNSDEETDSLVIYVYYNRSTHRWDSTYFLISKRESSQFITYILISEREASQLIANIFISK